MLNRLLNFPRRHKDPAGPDDLAFPPRKRAMATTCFGQSDAEDPHAPSVTAADALPASPGGPDAGPLAAPREAAAEPQHAAFPEPSAAAQGEELAGPAAPPAAAAPAATIEEPELALEQMRLSIQDGLLMVSGPEGDPVPPHAFGAAATLRPDAPLALPDGTIASAFRVAAVLGAQLFGRLGAAEHGEAWILAMLRDGEGPTPAPDEALRAEQASAADGDTAARAAADPAATGPGVRIEPTGAGPRLTLDREGPSAASPAKLELDRAADGPADHAAADGPMSDSWLDEPLAADAPVGSNERIGSDESFGSEQGSRSEDLILHSSWGPCDARAPADAPLTAEVAVRSEGPSRADASLGSAAVLQSGEPARLERPEAAQPGEAREADLDPDSMVLVVMRGVPEDASLSTGIRDDDGSWSISPIDLATVTISLASQGEGPGEAAGGDRDLTITGIAFGEDGELVAMSETVPLADYLAAPAPADPAPKRREDTALASAPGAAPAPRVVRLEVDPRTLAGKAFDALVIRGVPSGARLSAGAYDPAIAGWVLRPQDLSALALLTPPDLRGDFGLTLLGIALRSGNGSGARALTGLTVTLT